MKRVIREKLPSLVSVFKGAESQLKQQSSRVRIARLLRYQKPLFIEVGSGDKPGVNGWVTIDMTPHCDVYWDLRKGLPFPDASVAKIYSSHFFEHLTYKEAQAFLSECLRVLQPGGTFSICVPNARLYLDAYINRRPLDPDLWLAYRPALNDTTIIDYANYVGYMDGHHKYMFDEENVIHILRQKGFTNVRLREFDPALDSADRHFESIYAQAEKENSA